MTAPTDASRRPVTTAIERLRAVAGGDETAYEDGGTPFADLPFLIAAHDGAMASLKTALSHIEHMTAWITQTNLRKPMGTYSFESLGEDMPGMKAALAPRPVAETGGAVATVPIHPKNGPLWQETKPTGAAIDTAWNYERMALYASPAAPADAVGAREAIARAILFRRGGGEGNVRHDSPNWIEALADADAILTLSPAPRSVAETGEPVAWADSEGLERPLDAEAKRILLQNPTVKTYTDRFSIPLFTGEQTGATREALRPFMDYLAQLRERHGMSDPDTVIVGGPYNLTYRHFLALESVITAPSPKPARETDT